MYINAHSYYSLRYGIVSPEELIDIYLDFGLNYCLLTDINNTSACLDFIRMAQLKKNKAYSWD
jgi:DNA polymerase-3 subunit alpha